MSSKKCQAPSTTVLGVLDYEIWNTWFMNPCQPVTESFSVFSRKICFVLYFFGYLGLSKNSGVKCDLILALLGQIFEYLRETLYRHALEYLQSACSEKKWKKSSMETPGHYWPFRRPVVGGDTFSPLAPVKGPEQKTRLWHPLPLCMAVSMIQNMWHSSR